MSPYYANAMPHTLIDGKGIVDKCRRWVSDTSDEQITALVALLLPAELGRRIKASYDNDTIM